MQEAPSLVGSHMAQEVAELRTKLSGDIFQAVSTYHSDEAEAFVLKFQALAHTFGDEHDCFWDVGLTDATPTDEAELLLSKRLLPIDPSSLDEIYNGFPAKFENVKMAHELFQREVPSHLMTRFATCARRVVVTKACALVMYALRTHKSQPTTLAKRVLSQRRIVEQDDALVKMMPASVWQHVLEITKDLAKGNQ